MDLFHSVLLHRLNSHSRAPKKNVVWQPPGDYSIISQGCRNGC